MIGVVQARSMLDVTSEAVGSTGHRPGILIADDMALVLTLLKVAMEARGFKTWCAVDGQDAFATYQEHHAEIALVLLDVQMPCLDGLKTLAAIRHQDPDIRACFMTGSLGTYSDEDLLDRGACCVFHKPFHPEQVADTLQFLARATNVGAASTPRRHAIAR